jgi:ribosomal-protein-alanine N-acetyltransferase
MFAFGEYVLRRAEARDAEGLRELCLDREAMRYYGGAGFDPADPDGPAREIDWFNGLFGQGGGRWAISRGAGGEYLGDIGFSGVEPAHRRAEIGFKLRRELWGRGITGAFVGLLLPYAFGELGYNRIEAKVDVRNPGSARVLAKNGFVREGTLREYELEADGFVDLDVYALLRRDHAGKP